MFEHRCFVFMATIYCLFICNNLSLLPHQNVHSANPFFCYCKLFIFISINGNKEKNIFFYHSLISIITKIIMPIIIGLINLLLSMAHQVCAFKAQSGSQRPGSIPCPLQHVLPSVSHTSLSFSLYHKASQCKKQSLKKKIAYKILAIHKCNFIQY